MSEPKKRGRPSKADIAAREAGDNHIALIKETILSTFPAMNGDTSREPETVIERQAVNEAQAITADTATLAQRAQVLALRVWSGQSADLKRAERIARVERALHGQNLPTDGIRYPGSDDDEEWGEEDMQPVTWRKRS
jgi:hypothetical protein